MKVLKYLKKDICRIHEKLNLKYEAVKLLKYLKKYICRVHTFS